MWRIVKSTMKFFMSDKVFTFMAKHHNHKLPHHFWQKPVSARSGAQNTPIKREAGEKLKTNEYIQVCLFVLCRRVVDGYHSIFQVGTTVRLLRDFLSYSTKFLGGLPSKYYPGPTMLSVIGRMVVKRIARSF